MSTGASGDVSAVVEGGRGSTVVDEGSAVVGRGSPVVGRGSGGIDEVVIGRSVGSSVVCSV